MTSREALRSVRPPKLLVPRPTRETSMPNVPSFLFCIFLSVTLRCERSEPRRATARAPRPYPSRAASRPPQDDGRGTEAAMNDNSLKFLHIGDGAARRGIAVRAQAGVAPGLFWLGGYKSDMKGTKAVALADWAAGAGRACVRFDY